MTTRTVPNQTSADIAARCGLVEHAEELRGDQPHPRPHVERLILRKQYRDAIRFVAELLSKRHAVTWACRCIRSVYRDEMPAQHERAVMAAEAWAGDPTEENRTAAFPLAERAGLNSPAGCLAAAAFFSGGSLGPPHVAPIRPHACLTARAVTGAVMMSGVVTAPEKAAEKYAEFVACGIGLLENSGQPDSGMDEDMGSHELEE